MPSPNEEPPPYPDNPPQYTPNVHQQGMAGGKPVYVHGPAPTAPPLGNLYHANSQNVLSQPQPILIMQPGPSQPTIQMPAIGNSYMQGNCPACRVGTLQVRFTCVGILIAILLFPIGLLCCMFMTEKQCSSCGLIV